MHTRNEENEHSDNPRFEISAVFIVEMRLFQSAENTVTSRSYTVMAARYCEPC